MEGYRFPLDKLPRGIDERYIRLYFTVAGSSATAGKIRAGLIVDPQESYGTS